MAGFLCHSAAMLSKIMHQLRCLKQFQDEKHQITPQNGESSHPLTPLQFT